MILRLLFLLTNLGHASQPTWLSKAPIFDDRHPPEITGGYQPYWVCSDKKTTMKAKCRDLGVDRPTDPKKAELELTIRTANAVHHYGLRHGIYLEDCAEQRRGIRKLFKQPGLRCVAGWYGGHEKKNSVRSFDWVFFEARGEKLSVCDFCEWPAKPEQK